jgi:hypothetical protein
VAAEAFTCRNPFKYTPFIFSLFDACQLEFNNPDEKSHEKSQDTHSLVYDSVMGVPAFFHRLFSRMSISGDHSPQPVA